MRAQVSHRILVLLHFTYRIPSYKLMKMEQINGYENKINVWLFLCKLDASDEFNFDLIDY